LQWRLHTNFIKEPPSAEYNLFVPVVDGEGGLIPNTPEILASYRKKMPIMLGTTRDESSLKLLLTNDKPEWTNLSMTIDVPLAERLVDNLTDSYAGFINRPLIREACKHAYVWTKIDPSREEEPILFESILKVLGFYRCVEW